MKRFIKFFFNIQKLKEKKRRGWLLHQIENSESTASHIFRVAVLAWMLGKKERLNTEKLLKMALVHDVCEIFTFDETPYDPLLPKDVKTSKNLAEAQKILGKWPKFTFKQKKQKVFRKREREYKACLKLFSFLPQKLRNNLEALWLEFEDGLSREGRFLKQIDKGENFLQGMEYWENYGRIQRDLWIRWAREIFDKPILIEFEKAIERRFYEQKKYQKKEIDKILDFLINLGKLKTIRREGWVLRKVPEPETVAGHCFSVALMAWILAEKRRLNTEKLIKMALIHKFSKVYLPEFTPYDYILPNPREEIRRMIKEPSKFSRKKREEVMRQIEKLYKVWPKFSKKTREKIFQKEYRKEEKALRKLVSQLPEGLRNEITFLWKDFKQGLSREGKFLHQVKKIESLLQAVQYAERDKNFPIEPWWMEIREEIDDPSLIKLVDTLSKMEISKNRSQ